jgi:uncharacterized protein HemY
MDRKVLEKMLEAGNDNAMLRYTLGTLCYKEGLQKEAVHHLEQALHMDDTHSASWKIYARVLMKLGRLDEAKEAFQRGIAVAESRGDVQAAKEMKVFLKRLNR